jgi:hypothetical protein
MMTKTRGCDYVEIISPDTGGALIVYKWTFRSGHNHLIFHGDIAEEMRHGFLVVDPPINNTYKKLVS